MVRRFEELTAWQKARALVVPVYEVTKKGPASKDFAYTFQIRKAVLSIASNIAEGFERGRRAEFHQYLSIAKASCAEVRSQLYSGFDFGYMTSPQFESVLAQAEEVGRLCRRPSCLAETAGGVRKHVNTYLTTHDVTGAAVYSALSTQHSALVYG